MAKNGSPEAVRNVPDQNDASPPLFGPDDSRADLTAAGRAIVAGAGGAFPVAGAVAGAAGAAGLGAAAAAAGAAGAAAEASAAVAFGFTIDFWATVASILSTSDAFWSES